jgi:Glycosyl hydrolases family 32 N-terminal domain
MWPRLDFGNYYASKSFYDSNKGRRILCGWTNESDSSSDDVAKGWAGIHVSMYSPNFKCSFRKIYIYIYSTRSQQKLEMLTCIHFFFLLKIF